MVLSIVSIFYVTLFQCVCYLNFSMEIPRKRLKLTSLCITLNISGEMLPTYKCCCKSKMFFFRKPLLTLFLNQTLKEWIDSKSHNIWEKKKNKNRTYVSKLPFKADHTDPENMSHKEAACLSLEGLPFCSTQGPAELHIWYLTLEALSSSWKYNIHRIDTGICEK